MRRLSDRMVKGLVRGDVWDELLRLGLRLCPYRRQGRRRGIAVKSPASRTSLGPGRNRVQGRSR